MCSTIALATRGKEDEGSAAGPINGPSQWLWGVQEAATRRLTWRHTASGYAIHHAMSILWATLYESLNRGNAPIVPAQVCARAAAVAALAYWVDYHAVPRRLRPGFKKHLRPRSIFVVYAAFGAGLALATLLDSPRRRRE